MNNKSKKQLLDYMKLPYTVVLRRDEDGDVIAKIKEFEGCVADGEDEMEALGNLEVVKGMWIEACLNNGKAIPLPEDDSDLPSGKWLQRVPRSLHKKLVDRAEVEGVSLNQFVTSVLAEAIGQRLHSSRKETPHEAILSGSISAGAYASAPSKTRLRIVTSKGSRVPGGAEESADLPQSIEFAASQLQLLDGQSEKRYVSQRHASGY